ncbi:MAG: hypothetical protein ABSG92_04340 [Conexivisphaerales archaeon]
MSNPINETANWQTQYYLTVNSSHGSPQGAGWYSSGASASFSVTTPESSGTGIRYLFSSWNGDGSGSYSGSSASSSAAMNAAITETASWNTQYYLTVTSSYGSPTGQGWYDAGSPAPFNVSPTTVSGGTGIQYLFSSWNGDGSGSYSGSSASSSAAMNAAITETANWTTQYYYTVTSSYGSPSGAGWYDTGTTAASSVASPASGGTGPKRWRLV